MDRSIPSFAAVPVLLVDDDATLREILSTALQEEGHPVAETESIPAAAVYLQAVPTGHVVLLDWLVTHGGSGTGLLRQVEEDPTLQRHAYILLTGAGPGLISDAERRLIQARCAEVVKKPCDLTLLLEAVTRAAAQLAMRPSAWLGDGWQN